MKRLLMWVSSDFKGLESSLTIKDAILKSEGRTIICDISAETSPLYKEVTNGELLAAFGSDLLLLKDIDVKNPIISGLENEAQPLEKLRDLTRLGVGINLEITDYGPKFKSFNSESLVAAINLNSDFISLTGYNKPEVTPERIREDLKMIRTRYDGFLMLNPVVSHGMELDITNLISYIDAGTDLIVLPAPGSVPGVTEDLLFNLTTEIRKKGALVSATVGTSQESTDESTIKKIALSAKRSGVDVFELGDAGASGIASLENIFSASIAVRGKRHTYTRMARSAKR